MIRVESLHVYPVKSCRGIELDSADVVETGFRYDRQWMVVGDDGVFLSQRSHPVLASVTTRLERDRLVLETAGAAPLEIQLRDPSSAPRRVTVWDDSVDAVTQGEAAAEWFSDLLGVGCELVRQPTHGIRRVTGTGARHGDRVAFADGYPFLLISRASVDELNRRLDTPVSADRFRANIMVAGCGPHAEDDWCDLRIGDVEFHVAKPCARCVVVATDQRDGSRTPEPLRTLAVYRTVDGKVLFGQNLVHRGRGSVSVGDPVVVV